MLMNPMAAKKTMHVMKYTQMGLFRTSIVFPTDSQPGKIIVTFRDPNSEKETQLEVPLEPETTDLPLVDVVMHESPCQGYDMGPQFNSWFSECFGFPVLFLYLGDSSINHRKVLGNVSPNAMSKNPAVDNRDSSSWSILSTIKSTASSLYYGDGTTSSASNAVDKGITFADCAPFLIVSNKSLEDVQTRLPPDDQMIMEKFRPNIVLAGAEEAWEEDFWGELSITPASDQRQKGDQPSSAVIVQLTSNCARCVSINVDFTTGRYGTTASGSILKKLNSFRRVDKGNPYSPVFGRYGFLMPIAQSSEGKSTQESTIEALGTISVGDEVQVTKRIQERSHWCKCYPYHCCSSSSSTSTRPQPPFKP